MLLPHLYILYMNSTPWPSMMFLTMNQARRPQPPRSMQMPTNLEKNILKNKYDKIIYADKPGELVGVRTAAVGEGHSHQTPDVEL